MKSFKNLAILLMVIIPFAGTAQVINFPGGRIALSADGNQHDKDDWGATALALAMLDAAGLNNKVVHYDYANHLGDNNASMEAKIEESALGGADRFGFNKAVFFNDQEDVDGATTNLAAAINASSADDPLWIIAQGPMETVWWGINAANAGKRQYVRVISHSAWNNNHDDTPQMNHTWSDMKDDFEPDGTVFYKIQDQNSSNGDNDFNTPYEKWYWLRDSDNPDWVWIYNRNDKNSFDVSDAGMTYWLITGGPGLGCDNCGWKEAKALLENPVPKEKYFVEKDHYLCFEVEETESDLGEWIETTTVAGYTGESHFAFTGNSPVSGPANSPLVYKLKINNPGRYRMIIRAHKDLQGEDSDKCNDGYVKMEGDLSGNTAEEIGRLTVANKFFGGAANGWGWALKLDIDHNKYNAEYEFIPGIYTFTIYGRSQRWNIDRVVFFETSQHSIDWAQNSSLQLTPIEHGGTVTDCSITTLEAVSDFPVLEVSSYVPAYIDNVRNAIAIDASKYKDTYAAAMTTWEGNAGYYTIRITTLTETDGESSYYLRVGNDIYKTFTNPKTDTDYEEAQFTWENVVLDEGSKILVCSNSASNGKVPEGQGFAYARGRWTKLEIVRQGCSFYESPPVPPDPTQECVAPTVEGGNGAEAGQEAYLGVAQEIPGTVWAYKFDAGGEGVAYHDSDTGNNGVDFSHVGVTGRTKEDVDLLDKNGDGIPETGWTESGEWLEYTLAVLEEGLYQVTVSAAANATGKTIYFKVNDYTSCKLQLTNTGDLKTYATSTTLDSIPLSEGIQVISVVAESGQLNLEKFVFNKVGDLPVHHTALKKDLFLVYPNPVSGNLTIERDGMNSCTLKIIDLCGREILNTEFLSGQRIKVLDTSYFKPGIYILSFEDPLSRYVRKITKR